MSRAAYLSLVLCGAALCACPASQPPARAPESSGSTEQLDPAKVPAELRSLIPLAQEWGIGDDLDRGAKVERATPSDRERLRAALGPYQARITTWLDSFGKGQMSNEAAAFMYMQLALEEMPNP